LLNSSSVNAISFKGAITAQNWKEKKESLEAFSSWLRCLKSTDGKLISSGQRKAFVVGFCITIKSTIQLTEDLLFRECKFPSFFTRLIQQDPLELYFGMIRQRCGSNDNPDVIQLKAALKRLIVTRDDTMLLLMDLTKNSNCSAPPAIIHSPEDEENFLEDDEAFNLGEFLIIDSLNVDNSDAFKRLKLDTLAYLSGYVVTQLCKIQKTVKSPLHISSLLYNEKDPLDDIHCQLIKIKNSANATRGGLAIPSKTVLTVILEAQKVFEKEVVIRIANNQGFPEFSLLDTLTNLTMDVIQQVFLLDTLFPLLSITNPSPTTSDDKLSLIRIVVCRYLKVRSLSYPHVFNSRLSKRKQLSKQIQFFGM